MTIEEQLNLLEEKLNKAIIDRTAIIEAIRSKGVSIPDNTLLEDIPIYIMEIGDEKEIIEVINGVLYLYDKYASYDEENEKLTIISGANVSGDKLVFGDINEDSVSNETLITNNSSYKNEQLIISNAEFEQENNRLILN